MPPVPDTSKAQVMIVWCEGGWRTGSARIGSAGPLDQLQLLHLFNMFRPDTPFLQKQGSGSQLSTHPWRVRHHHDLLALAPQLLHHGVQQLQLC